MIKLINKGYGHTEYDIFNKIILQLMIIDSSDAVEELLSERKYYLPSFSCRELTTKNSLLHLAALHNRVKIANMLCSAGACINEKNNNRETPLDMALRLQHYSVVKIILANSAKQLAKQETNNILDVLITLNMLIEYLLSISNQLDDDQIKFLFIKSLIGN